LIPEALKGEDMCDNDLFFQFLVEGLQNRPKNLGHRETCFNKYTCHLSF
jgi:hypothetical protein